MCFIFETMSAKQIITLLQHQKVCARRVNKCSVLNCTDKIHRRHRFPKSYPDIMKQWIEKTKNPRFKDLSNEQIWRNNYICERHFAPDCFVPGTRRGMMVDAVPSLYLGDTEHTEEQIPMKVVTYKPSQEEMNVEAIFSTEETEILSCNTVQTEYKCVHKPNCMTLLEESLMDMQVTEYKFENVRNDMSLQGPSLLNTAVTSQETEILSCDTVVTDTQCVNMSSQEESILNIAATPQETEILSCDTVVTDTQCVNMSSQEESILNIAATPQETEILSCDTTHTESANVPQGETFMDFELHDHTYANMPKYVPSQVESPLEIFVTAQETEILSHHTVQHVKTYSRTVEKCKRSLTRIFEEMQPENNINVQSRTPKIHLPKGKSMRSSRLSEVNVTRQKDLTPKAKHFYKKYAEWATRASILHKRAENYKKRARAAEKLCKNSSFKKIMESVNQTTHKFILSQIRSQHLPKRNRRFTLNDKVFALSIMKSAQRGYRFLSKVFALPSRRTLLKLLSKLPISPGINKDMFTALKGSVEKMKPKERCCILLFDEMAIAANLQYKKGSDSISGLEDSGSVRKPAIADHVNVFMIKGIYKLWKEALAFTVSSGPIKSSDLACQIKEIIQQCQSIKLDVIATVCGQNPANEAAINKLMKETNDFFLSRGKENRNFGFTIDEKEIIPLYDVPHLFKGFRNNMLEKDVHFELSDKVMKVAKWDHVEQFYRLDTAHDTRICPKLTDKHVIKHKINKMKVSLCTQVFSH